MLNPILKIIADDPSLAEELKKALKAEFEVNEALDVTRTNDELGQIVRSRLEGLRKIDEAFRKIAQLKSPEKKPTGENPAR